MRVCLDGREQAGFAEVFDRDEAVVTHLSAYLRRAPQYARYYGVSLAPDGQPDEAEVARAARERVIVRFRMTKNSQ